METGVKSSEELPDESWEDEVAGGFGAECSDARTRSLTVASLEYH